MTTVIELDMLTVMSVRDKEEHLCVNLVTLESVESCLSRFQGLRWGRCIGGTKKSNYQMRFTEVTNSSKYLEPSFIYTSKTSIVFPTVQS